MSYRSAHDDVRRLHGPASAHRCVRCAGPAQHWAYQHNDPEEQRSPEGYRYGRPEHYAAMCVQCHVDFDDGTKAQPWLAEMMARDRSLPCPHCGVAIGVDCRMPNGVRRYGSTHTERHRALYRRDRLVSLWRAVAYAAHLIETFGPRS